MTAGYSIRARLLLGAALVLVAFIAGAGLAVQRAHADSVRAAHFSRLQGTVYLLLARAELDEQGALVMPPTLAEPRLALPQSGLYASIDNVARKEQWRSASSLGVDPPFQREGVQPGQWRIGAVQAGGKAYHAVSYGVNWAADDRESPLVLSVVEDSASFDREVAVFARTMWIWLGGAAALLLLAQLLLLGWGLAPLRRVAVEVRRIEHGEQARIEGRYPDEIVALTDNLNTLIQQERVRQGRYKEALSFLAHSLKTPLAVLRNALAEPAGLPAAVQQQVQRMDDIVQHQLGRAAAGGATRFAPPVLVAPVLERIAGALRKVYAERGLALTVDCPPDLGWRIDEGDLFEVAGNVMDNAAKWARTRVAATAALADGRLRLVVDDDGPGFSDTQSILQLHVRLDERVPGHGVGLAVVNDLVASHRGELALGRAGLGGARVEITLPPP
ncbi:MULTISPECIES: ATP-binding protein [Ramlibacter]|uniref:histidine kinase n=1 Tax=Ramlibacter pinisoli TaxID=2682844 RepID=A0A6N8ISL6_9BURK|nr:MULTISPECIES: ATP-binding protein [Ramlibacter]MBA2964234.1 histidine kinase [Ramlibacter sp. CGMCC 1.13660]MVQ29200.1 histidine kinase [Ramlibacter pinisoli]